ncbi:MAG: hypothetical protein HGB36_11710 [Chlorobiaceae bacterium]|jgi:hypothetical protein|nr:hypothetical protein [Chlorobiaceae bacterium]
MSTVSTKYGELKGVEFRSLFSNKKIDGCVVTQENILKTPYGSLVPVYESEDLGRRNLKPVYFNKDGSLKSISLQSQTVLDTPAGKIPAELVTFYKNGSLKRIFPLDGKLSGFWSWKNELALTESITLDTPAGTLTAKFIGIQFFESGALKSLTLWPGETIALTTPVGKITARKGVAFYETGEIRSFEPLRKIDLSTPIGMMSAYDNEPNGIHGDVNSVQLTIEGTVEALSTVDHEVEVSTPEGSVRLFKPGIKNNVCGDERKISVPMKVRFEKSRVIFHDNPDSSFDLQSCRFDVRQWAPKTEEPTYSCAG